MPISPYVRALREKVGHGLLVLQAATVIVFDESGRALLARDAETGLWMTTGGTIEPGEQPADAAVRECWEETGLVVELIRLIGVFGGPDFRVTYSNSDVATYIAVAFEGRRVGGALQPDGIEAAELRYVAERDALALPMAPWTREMIGCAFRRDAAPYFAPATWSP